MPKMYIVFFFLIFVCVDAFKWLETYEIFVAFNYLSFKFYFPLLIFEMHKKTTPVSNLQF